MCDFLPVTKFTAGVTCASLEYRRFMLPVRVAELSICEKTALF